VKGREATMEHLEEVGTRDKTQAVVPKESIKEVSEGSILERRQEGQSLDHCWRYCHSICWRDWFCNTA